MHTIFNIPEEIIYQILCSRNINIKDFVRFSSTCKHFHDMFEKNSLWRHKFYERWPRLKTICEREMSSRSIPIDFKELTVARIKCRSRLQNFLREMNRKYHTISAYYLTMCEFSAAFENKEYIANEELDLLVITDNTTYPLNYHLIMDELKSLLKTPKSGYANLTNIYYGKVLFPFLKHYYLRNVWKESILRCRCRTQCLEHVATIFAQWHKPNQDIDYFYIKRELRSIAAKVIKQMEIDYPMHRIFWKLYDGFMNKEYKTLMNINYWKESEGRCILKSIIKVLSSEFRGLVHPMNTGFRKKDLFIDHMLKEKVGSFLLLAVIYQSIAKKLGLKCNLLKSTEKFYIIRWQPIDKRNYVYISFDENISLRTPKYCKINILSHMRNEMDTYTKMNSVELIDTLCSYIINIHKKISSPCTWELLRLIIPNNLSVLELLSDYYQEKHVYPLDFVSALEKLYYNAESRWKKDIKQILEWIKRNSHLKNCEGDRNKKYRLWNMKYAIGMIVSFKDNQTKRGVIIGWHQNLDTRMRYYAIACENNEFHYTAEGVIQIESNPRPINNNSKLGRYFCKYKNNHYVPNEVLKEHYPEDVSYLLSKL